MATTTDAIILNCAFRYALGRSTYVVSVVVEQIHRVWDTLEDSQKMGFVREITEHKVKFGKLGHACDERDWNTIIERFENERSILDM